MKKMLGVPLIAVVLLAVAASSASACYCCAAGAAVAASLLHVSRLCVLPAAMLHGHEDLQASRVREAGIYLPQDVLGAGVRAEDNHLHPLRSRNLLP